MRSPHSTGSKYRTLRSLRFGLALFAATATAIMGAASASTASTANPADTAASPAGATGQVHYVHTHGETVKVETHGRFGAVPMTTAAQRAHAKSPAAAGTLFYNGGPVQHAVSVYLVFWGNQWNSDGNGVESYEQNLFGGLGTSQDSWSTVTSQYTDDTGQGPSFGGSVLRGSWVDSSASAPQSASAAQIAAEATVGAQHFGVSGDDVQIVVLSPSGTSPDGFPNTGFCAWHDYNGTVPYTNMPYVLDAGSSCGADSVQSQLDGFSIVNGHEYAETATDPEPASGWVASDGEENGDLCAWQNLGAVSLPTGSFAMQPTWSNAVGGCAMSGSTQAPPADPGGPTLTWGRAVHRGHRTHHGGTRFPARGRRRSSRWGSMTPVGCRGSRAGEARYPARRSIRTVRAISDQARTPE